MTIARDISRQGSKQTATLTADQTAVTVTGGFSGSSIDVYLNGSRIVQGQDYSLNGTSGITLSQGASAGDIIEFVIRNTSNSGFSAADTGQIVDGAVTYDKLSDSSTESDNVAQRVAKAWVNVQTEGTVTINESFNVSSVTDVSTGNFDVNFTTSMTDTNYCCVATADVKSAVTNTVVAVVRRDATYTSKTRIITTYHNNVMVDCSTVTAVVFR